MNFVVLSYARSGSTWLVNTLNNIPGVTCYDELFTLKELRYRAGATDFPFFFDWEKAQKHTPYVWRYLNQLYAGKQKIGFKLMFLQAKRHWGVFPYVVTKKIGIIHLIRRNVFDTMLSLVVAQNRGKFHFSNDEEIPDDPLFQVNTTFLIRRIKRAIENISYTRKQITSYDIRTLEVCYEDLLDDRQNFEPIWDFLDIDFLKEPPKWELKKIRKENNFNNILNFEEVKDALQVAGFEHYLND